MRILWIVNMLMPDAAEFLNVQTGSSGTWMIDISRELAKSDNMELAIACIYGKEFRKFSYKNTTYYLLPGSGKNMLIYTRRFEKLWKQVCAEFQPDIVHLHGTEYSHGLAFMRACPNIKSIISVQGIINRIKDVDFGEIPVRHFVFGRTWSQNLRLNGEIELHFLHKRNAKHEREMLCRANYINGVNTWDTSLCKSINPNLKVFKLEYNLRDSFYSSPKWNSDKMEPFSIFTNPGGVPLKGIHKLIEAMALLKNRYPHIRLYVPGMADKKGKLALTTAYARYIHKLIRKNNLQEHIVFLGRLDEIQMREQMLRANVVVIPSAIESVSLILREAMYLGCPCISAFRGGMADFIEDKKDGFVYDFQESAFLATRLSQLFDDCDLCNQIAKKAIEKATAAHDRKRNVEEYLRMYSVVLSEGNAI